MGYALRYRIKDTKLRALAEMRQSERMAYNYHKPSDCDANELKRCMLVVALKNLREVDAESALMIPCGEMSAVLHLPNVLRLQAQKRWWSRRSPLWKVPGAL
jgi:hypothetical protein